MDDDKCLGWKVKQKSCLIITFDRITPYYANYDDENNVVDRRKTR